MKKENPIPQGKYIPAKRIGDTIYTAGMTPRDKGVLIKTGKVMINDPIEDYKECVTLAASNALTAAENTINDGESLEVLSIYVFVNAERGFTKHAKIGDFVSDYLYENLKERGIASRAAVGVESLPGDAPVEVQLVLAVVK